MKKLFSLPNLLTLSRIAGSVALLFIRPLSTAFYIVYTVSGISDALDGFFARLTNSTSDFGAKLDSISDIIFYAVMIIRLMPVLIAALPVKIWYFVAFILLIRLVCYMLAAFKYKRFAAMHTYLNKLTGLSVFLIPYFVRLNIMTVYCFIACAIGTLASVEEIIIHICSKSYDPNVKSIIEIKAKEEP